MSEHTATAPHYGTYWKAWLVLLAITAAMLFVQSPGIVILGITLKALIILLVFMHLKNEHKDIVATVGAGIFATALVMYFLMAWDASGM